MNDRELEPILKSRTIVISEDVNSTMAGEITRLVTFMEAENPEAPVLYWVGCAASYDDRAKKIARSTAKLLKAAGVPGFGAEAFLARARHDPARFEALHPLLFAAEWGVKGGAVPPRVAGERLVLALAEGLAAR